MALEGQTMALEGQTMALEGQSLARKRQHLAVEEQPVRLEALRVLMLHSAQKPRQQEDVRELTLTGFLAPPGRQWPYTCRSSEEHEHPRSPTDAMEDLPSPVECATPQQPLAQDPANLATPCSRRSATCGRHPKHQV